MSEHLTHIAVYEDSARLVLNTDRFCSAFRKCVKAHYDSGMLASGARGNHLFAVPILESYKDRWEEVSSNTEVCQQIAGAIGWISHRAADHQMKPTWRAKTAEDPDFPETEMQIYHDSVTFREVYRGGTVTTGSPYELITPHTLEKELKTHPASSHMDLPVAEELITYLFQKEFVELHKFHKQRTDVGKWMDDFVEYHQEYTEDLRTYIEAFNAPDPEKMETYVYGINFYNPEDPLIQWARGIQLGHDVSGIDLDQALDLARSQSHFAQAILRGYTYLKAADDYFTGSIDKDAVYDALDIQGNNRL